MPDTEKPPVKMAPPAPPAPPKRELVDAGGATDGVVQHLLAQRQIHAMNQDSKAAEDVTAQLNELGYR